MIDIGKADAWIAAPMIGGILSSFLPELEV
jgi:hypothetical protein